MADTLQKDGWFWKEHPNIDVKRLHSTSAGCTPGRILSGDVPDIINIYPPNMDFQKEWAKAGYFAQMSRKTILRTSKNDYAENYTI